MPTSRTETVLVGLLSAVTMIGIIVLSITDHAGDITVIVGAAAVLIGLVRNQLKLSEVRNVTADVKHDTQTLLNGGLQSAVSAAVTEAMAARSLTDPPVPPPPTDSRPAS